MKVGILGSGTVGRTIGGKLAERGHDVFVGSREPGKLKEWLAGLKGRVQAGTLAEAARHGEIVFNCTAGAGSLDALRVAGEGSLANKVLVDVANPLDFSKGMPPTLLVCNTDSLGEQIQRSFPRTRVVKALNTMNALLMVDPAQLAGGEHDLFLCGNDDGAKRQVTELLKKEFGWKSVIDLGDIGAARGMEMSLPFWLRLYGVYQSPAFNYRIVR